MLDCNFECFSRRVGYGNGKNSVKELLQLCVMKLDMQVALVNLYGMQSKVTLYC